MEYDVIVIGGGHAGCEASHAVKKLGKNVLLVTGNIDMIASLPCNPSIGGPAKGIIVREIDALGGIMGEIADKSQIQMKLLNVSKGPAVRALRGQVDKVKYPEAALAMLRAASIDILEGYVKELLIENNTSKGVLLEDGTRITSSKVIVTTGTYLSSKILVGSNVKEEGPDKQKTTSGISTQLRKLGFDVQRLKTGTPARLKKGSIDFSKTTVQPGDDSMRYFSHFSKEKYDIAKQHPCYLTYTNLETHKLIQSNLEKSAMYSGNVKGVGARYCPSIEDKIVRFSDKDRHQIFLEPESLLLDEIYVQGLSSSLPVEIQDAMLRTIDGLENCEVVRYAYAIEYDAINPINLYPTLETKIIKGLYTAGQINSTSGYEEAGAQGLVAGINAVLSIGNKEPLILNRSQAYIGVLIDDLVTKGTKEPYRMLTSRAEHRLLLRNDNADSRLSALGYEIGLLSRNKYEKYKNKKRLIDECYELTKNIKIKSSDENNKTLSENDIIVLKESISVFEFLKRPNTSFDVIDMLIEDFRAFDEEIKESVDINIKYEGYINKALKHVETVEKLDKKKLPNDIDYKDIKNLSLEAREKLELIKPATIGQASRISGVNPADISILLIYLEVKNGRD